MTARLPPQPWLDAPATVAVMDALEAAGGADCARFVGGAVRNALLGLAVDDIDIATTLTPQETTAALTAANIKAVPTGVDHGTVTAVAGGRPFEITTLRRDVETDGRHAVVAFTKDWGEDARRRDFTLNALYADRSGDVLDPVGRGVEDALARRVVFVGEARDRIREDYLRILRFFRFQAWYGRGEPDAEALTACAELKDGMARLAAERIAKELLKLLAAEDPRESTARMSETGVLALLLPEAGNLRRLDRLVQIQATQFFEADPVLRLAALLPGEPPTGLAVAERLRLSNDQRDRLAAALGTTPRLTSWMSAREVRRAIYAVGAGALADRALLAWAGAESDHAAHQWLALVALAKSWTPPALPVGGEDVIAAGVPKGPKVGEVLKEVELWWIDQDFIDDRQAALERLKAVVEGVAS